MRGRASSVSCDQQTLLIKSAISNLYSTVEMFTTRDGPAVIDHKVRYWPKIAIFAPIRGFPSEYCHNAYFWYRMEKQEVKVI